MIVGLISSYVKGQIVKALIGPTFAVGWYFVRGGNVSAVGDPLYLADAAALTVAVGVSILDATTGGSLSSRSGPDGGTPSPARKLSTVRAPSSSLAMVSPYAVVGGLVCFSAVVVFGAAGPSATTSSAQLLLQTLFLGTRACTLLGASALEVVVVRQTIAAGARGNRVSLNRWRQTAEFRGRPAPLTMCVSAWSVASFAVAGAGIVWSAFRLVSVGREHAAALLLSATEPNSSLTALATTSVAVAGRALLGTGCALAVLARTASRTVSAGGPTTAGGLQALLAGSLTCLYVRLLALGSFTGLDTLFSIAAPALSVLATLLTLARSQDEDRGIDQDDSGSLTLARLSLLLVPATTTWFAVALLFSGGPAGSGSGWIATTRVLQLGLLFFLSLTYHTSDDEEELIDL